jgi:hypothetical protein
MIENLSSIWIYNDKLGTNPPRKGRLVRIAPEGYYDVLIEVQGRWHAAFVPIDSSVVIAANPEEQVATIEVER